MKLRKRIYVTILELLDKSQLQRRELLEKTVQITKSKITKDSASIYLPALRGEVGAIINEVEQNGIIALKDGKYTLLPSKPVALRSEGCEKEILSSLKNKSMTKIELRSHLEEFFGTNKTATVKDDNMLYSMIGQILKRLLNLGLIKQQNSVYYIEPEKAAKIDDISCILSLKNEFLTRLHAKGGEFFENYFMTLLEKYLVKHGKTVTENKVTGGSADGGIDGIIKTVDALGFRELLMVQTKNRTEITSETVVRAFYGAVCAANGSRGIFATTSDFHPSAKKLLNYIDNCVGINGDKIFDMATECLFGIKKRQGKYIIDSRIV